MITWIGASLGEYVIESLLGEGSYSWVYSCLGSGNEQHAIKAAKPDDLVRAGVDQTRTFPTQALLQATGSVLKVQPDAGELLQAQISKLQAVRTAGMPRILEYSLASGLSYYVMDIVRGKTLRQLMQEGPQPIELFIALAQTLDALQKDPAFLWHGDLKPENIMVHEDKVVILDPGYFGPLKTMSGMRPDVAVTTPAYYPSLQPDDMRAFAFILWEAATGRHPLSGDSDGTIDDARHGPKLAQYVRGCQAVGKGRFISGLLALERPSRHTPDSDVVLETVLLRLLGLQVDDGEILERSDSQPTTSQLPEAVALLTGLRKRGKIHLDVNHGHKYD